MYITELQCVQRFSLSADEDPDRVALAKLRGKVHGCHPIPVHSVNLQPDSSGARFPSGSPIRSEVNNFEK